MGTILHEGEYILLSNKVINETQYMGYSILSRIGINTSKVNYLGLTRSTKHFSTYAVAKDLELPFSTSKWQDFKVENVRFHAFTHDYKNLILLEHDESSLDYTDEIHEFFEKEKKEKEKKENMEMKFKANNYIYIATNTSAWNDDRLIEALLGYMPADMEHHNITPCGVLWSKNKLFKDNWFNVDDANERLHNLDEKLKFTVTARGDIIIYKDIYGDVSKIFEVYNRIIKQEAEDNDKLRKRHVSMALDSEFSLHSKSFITMPRNLGRSQAMSMLNSIYGLNPSFQAGLLRWGDWDSGFKLYFGVERATGKQKTVCLWKDGEKTIIRGDKSVLSMPVQYAVAWCYVKRRFKTTSQFKKYVDDRSFVMDGITYFEGDARVKGAQASANNRTKKYDIYDAAALAITTKHYGSVKTIMTYCDGWGE